MGPFSVRMEVLNYTHAGEHLLSAALVSPTPPFTPHELESIECYAAEVAEMIRLVRPTGSSSPLLKEVRLRSTVQSLCNSPPSQPGVLDYRHQVYEYVQASEALLQVNELREGEKELVTEITSRISVKLLGSTKDSYP
jgi:hypothetical protein